MHEVALIESIVAAIEERVHPAQVQRVRLQVGQLAGVLPDALRFAFDVCSRGTILEGAALDIQQIEGRARCRVCAREMALASFLEFCACGSAELDVLAGEELRIQNVEVQ